MNTIFCYAVATALPELKVNDHPDPSIVPMNRVLMIESLFAQEKKN